MPAPKTQPPGTETATPSTASEPKTPSKSKKEQAPAEVKVPAGIQPYGSPYAQPGKIH